jgi:dihydroorotate dehydrogenase (fumarate)
MFLCSPRLTGTEGGWTSYARLLEQAGDSETSGAEVERQMLEIVRNVKRELHIPVAVKLSPLFTAFGHFAAQLDLGE